MPEGAEASGGAAEKGAAQLDTPVYYEWLRTFLLAGTGAVGGWTGWQHAAMTDLEATCIALGATRYAERQPGTVVAELVEHSDLAAIVIGGGVYVARNTIAGVTVLLRYIQVQQEAQRERERAARTGPPEPQAA